MPGESTDPTVIRSIAVTTGDVVAALELNRTSDDHGVLRITPPFSARMRARLHVDRNGHGDNDSGDTGDERRTPRSETGQAVRRNGHTEHSGGTDSGHTGQDNPTPVCIDPEQLLTDTPAYPRPPETRAELLSDPERTYTVERHHEYHADAVQRWRESLTDCIRDQTTIDTSAGPTGVTVRTLETDLV